ncbi:hypothetical protein Pyrfu_1182 [Pyrolobus fumarii 1A]|uniref:Uncharacterized protein n=1 Tax=Pyrolobus fumarii (strain DSM 11204 / 1A) TaxID=694429 RepID=G0EFU4_PYRF1|nr:hypothetical protein Pyrfu_1182 [Pyrolobus fumarii 1A]
MYLGEVTEALGRLGQISRDIVGVLEVEVGTHMAAGT